GSGAFVVESTGIAGILNGQAGVASGNFSVGAEIGLQFNQTPSNVNETISLNGRTLVINVAANTFAFFGSGSLNLGNFVQITGSVAFNSTTHSFTLSNTSLFVGQGPYFGPDGVTPNPSAQGLSLTGAGGTVTQGTAAGTYILSASGATLDLVGIPGL